MGRLIHRFLLVLVALAVIGGNATQSVQAADFGGPVMMPCGLMMPMADVGNAVPMPPCKTVTPACVKQMCGAADFMLPQRMAAGHLSQHFRIVGYWSGHAAMAGVERTPEPLPPRMI